MVDAHVPAAIAGKQVSRPAVPAHSPWFELALRRLPFPSPVSISCIPILPSLAKRLLSPPLRVPLLQARLQGRPGPKYSLDNFPRPPALSAHLLQQSRELEFGSRGDQGGCVGFVAL